MTAGAADAAGFLYFAYGSNLNGARLRASCPSARLEGTARLAGWRLAFTRRSERQGGGVADILPAPGGEVLGAVWRIPRAGRDALDRQEGVRLDPPAYRPIEVAVTTPAGGALRCLAYRVAAPQPRHVPPPAAYLGAMLRGARDAGLGGAWAARIAAAARGEGAACGMGQVRSNSLRRP